LIFFLAHSGASVHVDLYLPLPLRILYKYQLPTYVLGVVALFCLLSSAAMGTAGLFYLLTPFFSSGRPQQRHDDAAAASTAVARGMGAATRRAARSVSPGVRSSAARAAAAAGRDNRGYGTGETDPNLPQGWKKVYTVSASADPMEADAAEVLASPRGAVAVASAEGASAGGEPLSRANNSPSSTSSRPGSRDSSALRQRKGRAQSDVGQ
jgi:hypothetical protein